ncbi:OprD family porin [Pseudomonas typographi]|uniref:OprD family porin n=1 Tax=Pseudomonas typographi TaxID=2715964 RepID=UPI001EED282A|nr:OprD family porin [Pseudomonas typographi]
MTTGVLRRCIPFMGVLLSCPALADEQSSAAGFLEGSHLQLLNRTYYLNRDLRNGASNSLGANAHKPVSARSGYREELAQGAMFFYQSGYTQGTLGVGADLHALFGLRLDGGGGRTGTSLMPWGNDGPPTDYSKGGAALKLRFSKTQLMYGEQFPLTPVFGFNDSRLLPGSATGLSLRSNELRNIELQAGHFTATSGPESSNHDGELNTNLMQLPGSRSVDYLGGTYAPSKNLSLSLYTSRLADIWWQHYAGAKYRYPWAPGRLISMDANLYSTHDTGASKGGPIDNLTGSLMLGLTWKAHKVSVGYQKVDGDEPMDWVSLDGTLGNVALANIMQVSHFTEPNETSWQLRYDLDLASFAVPGLTFMVRYTRGAGASNSHSDNVFYTQQGKHVYDDDKDNKHWERDIEIGYVVQSGAAKNLALRVKQSVHRSTSGGRYPDHDETRLIAEYPIDIF